MTTGAWVLLASLLLAGAVAFWRAYADGRFRGTHRVRGAEPPPSGAEPPSEVEVRGRPEVEPRPDVQGRGRAAPEPPDHRADDARTDPILPAHQLGERATLLQFSSAFCAPCRATRRVLTDVAATVPGVVHVEIDAEHHLDLVRRVGVLRTPTTLVLDAAGHEVTRASGAPKREQVLAAVAHVSA